MGQGSLFLAQLMIKIFGNGEQLGLSVLLISYFSFAMQFSDYGNSAYVVSKLKEGETRQVFKFFQARALIAIVCCAALVVWQNPLEHSGVLMILMLSIAGGAAGASCVGVFEYRGEYKRYAAIQATPWVLAALCLVAIVILPTIKMDVAGMCFCVSILGASIYASHAAKKWPETNLVNSRAIFAALSFIAPALGGQLMGRYVLNSIKDDYGLLELGDFGLLKYMQIACFLSLGFWLRPIHREIALRDREPQGLVHVIGVYKFPLIMAATISGVALSIRICSMALGHDLAWSALLLSAVFFVLSSIASQRNARLMKPGGFALLEYTGLAINLCFFIYLDYFGVYDRIAISESAQYIFISISSLVLSHVKK